jgi:hypothetical protein
MVDLEEIQLVLKPEKLGHLPSVLVEHDASVLEHACVECHNHIVDDGSVHNPIRRKGSLVAQSVLDEIFDLGTLKAKLEWECKNIFEIQENNGLQH